MRLKFLIEDLAGVAREKMKVSAENDDVTNFIILFYRNWDKMDALLNKLEAYCSGVEIYDKEELFDLLYGYVDGVGADEWQRYLKNILKLENEVERDKLFYNFVWYVGCRVLNKEAKKELFSKLEKEVEKDVPMPHMAKGEREYVINKLVPDERFAEEISNELKSEDVIDAVNEVFGSDDVGKLILLLGVIYQTRLRHDIYPAKNVLKLFLNTEKLDRDSKAGILLRIDRAKFNEYMARKEEVVRRVKDVLQDFDLGEYGINDGTIGRFVGLIMGLARGKTIGSAEKKLSELFYNKITSYLKDLRIKIKEKWSN